jgi:hypothetical protein
MIRIGLMFNPAFFEGPPLATRIPHLREAADGVLFADG